MSTYYAVCNINGPISHAIQAESVDDAVEQFRAADTQDWIDAADADAEDDLLDECYDGASEADFGDAMEAVGYVIVRDLDRIDNYHAGTSAHLAGGWMLWGPAGEIPPTASRPS